MSLDSTTRGATWRTRIVALAWGIGSIEHTVGLVGLWFGWQMYVHYPWWRHAAFAGVDALIAWLAVRRPQRLFLPLFAFLGEQVATNGVDAWQVWRDSHRVEWPIVLTLLFIALAVVAAHPALRAR